MTLTATWMPRASSLIPSLGLAAAAALGAQAHGQCSASVAVPPGQSCNLSTTITIVHGTFGTDSDTQSGSHTIAGTSSLFMPDPGPPFTNVTAQPFDLLVGGHTYSFSFFCFPFIGCQTLGVNLSSVTLSLPQGVSPVSGTGNFSFQNAVWNITADYTTSGIDNGTYQLVDVGTATLSGKLTTSGSNLTLNQLSLGTIHFDVPAKSLPAGINAISIDITANLATNSLVGPWAPSCVPADLNCDGEVDGIDLGQVLAGWGGPSGDTNGDGDTDGIDLGAVLASWGT